MILHSWFFCGLQLPASNFLSVKSDILIIIEPLGIWVEQESN
jgi:hypothetical protein